MTQLSLPVIARGPEAERREKKRGHVRSTSVETYQAQTVNLEGRANEVAIQLETWAWLLGPDPPTSAELAKWMDQNGSKPGMTWDARLLYVRRGLSDLQAKNVVEAVPHGKRPCRVSGRKCETWRVRQR